MCYYGDMGVCDVVREVDPALRSCPGWVSAHWGGPLPRLPAALRPVLSPQPGGPEPLHESSAFLLCQTKHTHQYRSAHTQHSLWFSLTPSPSSSPPLSGLIQHWSVALVYLSLELSVPALLHFALFHTASVYSWMVGVAGLCPSLCEEGLVLY